MNTAYTLTLSTLQIKANAFANSEELDKTAHNEPSHHDIHCHSGLEFLNDTPSATMDMSKSMIDESSVETLG